MGVPGSTSSGSLLLEDESDLGGPLGVLVHAPCRGSDPPICTQSTGSPIFLIARVVGAPESSGSSGPQITPLPRSVDFPTFDNRSVPPSPYKGHGDQISARHGYLKPRNLNP